MSYAAAVDGLFALAGELHATPGAPRRKFDLAEMRVLVEALGNPHLAFPSVLIAGTNGKGSTSATLASILRTAGYRVGLYTSPHLTRVNERIRIDGQDISDDSFAAHYFRVDDCARRLVTEGRLSHHPSFFETMTAVAFLAFAEAKVEIAVLEVGMGGRLDATNIVEPLISVITDISLDHMEWLGNTITEIAREKAGILRPNGVLVTLPQHPEANQAIGEAAVALNARGVNAAEYIPPRNESDDNAYSLTVLGEQIEIASPLHGAHQQRNVALAIAAAVELREHHGFNITAAQIAQGIHYTRWPGRLELFRQPGQADILLDVAHNPAGAWALRFALSRWQQAREKQATAPNLVIPTEAEEPAPSTPAANRYPRPTGAITTVESTMAAKPRPPVRPALTAVFGCLKDKAFAEMAQILFPMFDTVVLTEVASPRTASLHDLKAAADATGARATTAASPQDALAQAFAATPPGGLVVVTGSIYLIGALRPQLAEIALA